MSNQLLASIMLLHRRLIQWTVVSNVPRSKTETIICVEMFTSMGFLYRQTLIAILNLFLRNKHDKCIDPNAGLEEDQCPLREGLMPFGIKPCYMLLTYLVLPQVTTPTIS